MTKLTNRVISIFERKTSMRLAATEWMAVDDICKKEHIKRKKLFELIATNKDPKLGFTCSVRLFTITYMHNLILKNGYYREHNLNPANTNYENIFKTISNMN